MALPQVVLNYFTAQASYNTQNEAAITDLEADITDLNRIIEELKATPGTTTPEEDEILAALTAKGEELATKLGALAQKHPPTAPPA